ncbi:MAG TPA: EamA family transporter [Dehalococcoidia bacterium]|nr:EamA family transporter [Dehalococcoidia bacterium]HLB29371.1 EamA family transporter [Dehalococcoidia bacterium]
MLAPILALLAAAGVAGSAVCTRRGTLWGQPANGARLTILMGPLIFVVLATAFGEMGLLGQLSWRAWVFFGAAGVVHFVLGRTINYMAVQAIGASRGTVVTNLNPVVTVTLAMIIFGERLKWGIALGAPFLLLGPTLMAYGEGRRYRSPSPGPGAVATRPSIAQLRRGLSLAFLSAIFWGISPIFIKLGLEQERAPFLGAFISYSAAAVLVGSVLAHPSTRYDFFNMDPRGRWWYFLSGLSIAAGQCLRYVAFSRGDVTLVVLLMQTIPLWVLTFTFLLNRHIESLNRYIVAGVLSVTLGAAIIGYQR